MSTEVHLPRLVAYSSGPWFEVPRTHPTPWACHAKPATTGKTCGHVNAAGIHHNGNLCCEACGCTKVASDAREKT